MLALSGCGGSGVPEAVEAGWIRCVATDVAQQYFGDYVGIRPTEAGVTLLGVEDVSYLESSAQRSITFTGSTGGVRFRCIYNTYAKVASFDWGE